MCPTGWLVSPVASVASCSELSFFSLYPSPVGAYCSYVIFESLEWCSMDRVGDVSVPKGSVWGGSLFSSADPCEIGPRWSRLCGVAAAIEALVCLPGLFHLVRSNESPPFSG